MGECLLRIYVNWSLIIVRKKTTKKTERAIYRQLVLAQLGRFAGSSS